MRVEPSQTLVHNCVCFLGCKGQPISESVRDGHKALLYLLVGMFRKPEHKFLSWRCWDVRTDELPEFDGVRVSFDDGCINHLPPPFSDFGFGPDFDGGICIPFAAMKLL